MDHIRIKTSIHLTRNHALTDAALNSWRTGIARAIASALPGDLCVDTVQVTAIREASEQVRPELAQGRGEQL